MTRNTNLQDALFPVELTEIYHYPKKKTSQPELIGLEELQADKRPSKLMGYKAITNPETGQVFSIVTDGYRLVTNQEALGLAMQCFDQLFGEKAEEYMEVFNIAMPISKSFCHVDLIHRNYAVNVWAKEIWLPYIRFTNSYNRSRALRFDLGFCRQLCDNGMIFEKETLRYKFYHTRKEISSQGRFEIDFNRLKALEASFRESAACLRGYEVPLDLFLPLVCAALELKFDLQAEDIKRREAEAEKLSTFISGARPMISNYVEELGMNAYAALSVITDIASRPFLYRSPTWMIDHLQKRAGNWLNSFAIEIRRPGFSLHEYLGGATSWFLLDA